MTTAGHGPVGAAPRVRRSRFRQALAGAAVAFAAWWLVGLCGALAMTWPRSVDVGTRTELGGRPVEQVTTVTGDGVTVRGWLVPASTATTSVGPARCVVLAAGIHGNRLAMLTRAEWYLAHGWSTLLVDLRGTGASDAARIAMGWHEALDLIAWHAFLRGRGCAAIGAHGQSLGAAAIVYTAVRATPPPAWHFVVLESCYGDVDAALQARLPFVPRFLLWPLVACGEWLLGVDAHALRPVDAIAALPAPTLLAVGAADAKVGPDATSQLWAASPASDKRRLDIPGVAHGDLWRQGGAALPDALAAFLAGR
jgi:hypothetical protein